MIQWTIGFWKIYFGSIGVVYVTWQDMELLLLILVFIFICLHLDLDLSRNIWYWWCWCSTARIFVWKAPNNFFFQLGLFNITYLVWRSPSMILQKCDFWKSIIHSDLLNLPGNCKTKHFPAIKCEMMEE